MGVGGSGEGGEVTHTQVKYILLHSLSNSPKMMNLCVR